MTNKDPGGTSQAGLAPSLGIGVSTGPANPICGVETIKNVKEDEHEPYDERGSRYNLLGKVAGLLQRSLSRSREGSATDIGSTNDSYSSSRAPSRHASRKDLRPSSTLPSPPKETKQVFLEYDPITKRRVLNTYEILNDIGKGEHGKVKLARDLVHNELVAIKIVNRNSKDRPQLHMRRFSRPQVHPNEYSTKIRREIAIMKRCNHRHIVSLREVLDDMNSKKIYLVLEYLEKGEIKWKRKLDTPSPSEPSDEIPCCGSKGHLLSYTINDEDLDLLSNTFSPNLTFKQSRKIFRDVLLGLEYLHMLGIVHRDVKPANLLVSSDNVVKISDFGVSFALFLSGPGDPPNELELAKTAGTPAFFAPELCQTNFLSANSSKSVSASSLEILRNEDIMSKVLPRIDHKIDIWALGVTLYCLLFGKVPFNADSEYELFLVIVNQPLEFPPDRCSFNSRVEVSELEFDLAKDLLSKLLDKNKDSRIDIPEIKQHPFVLMDLANDMDLLNELLYLNASPDSNDPEKYIAGLEQNLDILKDDVDNAVVGLGSRIRRSVAATIKAGTLNGELMFRTESSSDESPSQLASQYGSLVGLRSSSNDYSVILSEAFNVSTPPPQEMGRTISNADYTSAPHFPSGLSNEVNGIADIMSSSSSGFNSNGNLPRKGSNHIVHDIIDSDTRSRRDSATGTEASQIETKRNAVGDVYLKNQSAMDAFKDIKLQDDKRRRSSAYLSSSQSGSRQGSTISRPTKDKSSISSPIPVPSLKRTTAMLLTVDPYIINDRDPSSVISLPLSDSLASLDSLNDDYVSRKYKELTEKHSGRRKSVSGRGNDAIFSDSDILSRDVDGINEKFLRFNLDTLMSDSSKVAKINDDAIAPKTLPRTLFASHTSSSSCCSSSSSSSGSSSGSDSDEDGDLTLAFSSKVASSVRPPFLSLSHRAKSYDSKLPAYGQSGGNHQETPVIFQTDLPEFEDLPAGLMTNVPRPSISGAGLLQMAPTISVMSNTSGKTLNPTREPPVSTPVLPQKAQTLDVSTIRDSKPAGSAGLRENIFHNQYNNHYKKDPISFPFPNAVHYENDRETESKTSTKKSGALRPNHYRSNSVAVGLLQHQLRQAESNQE